MNAVLGKEIRLLLPAWIAAMAASVLPVWVVGGRSLITGDRWNGGMEGFSLFCFAGGAVLLSLAAFGSEMSYGTFASLLAQPCPRPKTWRIKVLLLASGLALVSAASILSWWLWRFVISSVFSGGSLDLFGYACCVFTLALMAFAGGLWTTLLVRQMMAAFWFTILVPFTLDYAFDALAERLGLHLSPVESWIMLACAYPVAGFFLARWLFLHAQDKPEREAADTFAWSFLPAFPTRRRPVAALLVKELRLQQGTLVMAVALALLHLAAIAADKDLPRSVASKFTLLEVIWIVWLAAPLLVACASMAEERRCRTLESALCLPVAGAWQFAIKLLVVFGLGAFLGAVMPWLLEFLRPAAGPLPGVIKVIGLPWLLLTAATISALGYYGSSLSGTLLQAMGTTLLLAVALLSAILRIVGNGPLIWPVLIALCISLGYLNFKRLRMTARQWLLDGMICMVALFAVKFCWLALCQTFSLSGAADLLLQGIRAI